MKAASRTQSLLTAVLTATLVIGLTVFAVTFTGGVSNASEGEHALEIDYPIYPPAPLDQSEAEAAVKSAGCVSCHTKSDEATMHPQRSVVLGCTDCHGGDATATSGSYEPGSEGFVAAQAQAHVQPAMPETWEKKNNEV